MFGFGLLPGEEDVGEAQAEQAFHDSAAAGEAAEEGGEQILDAFGDPIIPPSPTLSTSLGTVTPSSHGHTDQPLDLNASTNSFGFQDEVDLASHPTPTTTDRSFHRPSYFTAQQTQAHVQTSRLAAQEAAMAIPPTVDHRFERRGSTSTIYGFVDLGDPPLTIGFEQWAGVSQKSYPTTHKLNPLLFNSNGESIFAADADHDPELTSPSATGGHFQFGGVDDWATFADEEADGGLYPAGQMAAQLLAPTTPAGGGGGGGGGVGAPGAVVREGGWVSAEHVMAATGAGDAAPSYGASQYYSVSTENTLVYWGEEGCC